LSILKSVIQTNAYHLVHMMRF